MSVSKLNTLHILLHLQVRKIIEIKTNNIPI